MDEAVHPKRQISSKLQREMDNLQILRDSMTKSEAMTTNMLSILTTFEHRLSKLENTINPIYRETGNLQRRHENIEKTVGALDHVIGYYHVAEEVEPTIRDGPNVGLSTYMLCMDKLQKAVQYLTVNNPGSSEMSQVTALYEAGKDALEKEFRNLLSRHGKPVSAITMLDILSVEDDGEEAEPGCLDLLPDTVCDDLKRISAWLLGCGYETDYMQVYATVRSSLLVRSLNNLRDHLQSTTKDNNTSISVTHSPAPSLKSRSNQTPVRKPSMRMAFVKKTTAGFKKHGGALDTPGSFARQAAGVKDEGCEVDMGFYIIAILALLKLIQSESGLMHGIVPEKHQRRVFDLLIQGALDLVVKDGELISQYIRKSTLRHNFAAVIHLFPILRQLRSLKPSFDITLEGCPVPTRNKLPTLVSVLDSTGAKALEEFVENIRNDPDKQSYMPKDGTVHELTSNTMLFLEQLLDFSDTAGAMLHTQDPNSLPNIPVADRPRLKLAEFFTKVLSALGLNLNNKMEAYSDPAIRSVFMLNNFNYILKSLRRSGMLDVVHLWNNEVGMFYEDKILDEKRSYSQRTTAVEIVQLRMPDIESHYMDRVQRYKTEYKQSWSRVIHYISENATPVPTDSISPDAKLKEKDRNLIKEKFAGFNKEMEEIYRIQKAFAIPDPELRDTLRDDNKKFVLPFYSAFLRRYRNAHFSKTPEKYIKYTEQEVSNFIDGFFDAAA